MELTPREIADSFRIRGSATYEICAGQIGLTEKQSARLKELHDRFNGIGKPLTENMKAERLDLLNKLNNPELPEGAKTHCKKWLKHFLYKRYPDLKNKYVTKGKECEEDGFTIMAVQLNLGMVYKNTERRKNDFCEGECDLHHNMITHDNKCSWDLDTFPMFESKYPDDKYWWQLQTYGILWPCETLSLCYTLLDAPEDMVQRAIQWEFDPNEKYKIAEKMIFTKSEFERIKDIYFPLSDKDYFVEIPEDERIKQFTFKPCPDAQKTIQQRAEMCKEYIYKLLTTK